MSIIFFNKCGSQNHDKAGVIKGEQRDKCKECTHQFIPNRERGRLEADKLLAVTLYLHGLSYRSIAKICKASPRAVFEWVKKYAQMIENNNMMQRHWFARFRRKTCVVSRSLEMIDLTMMMFASFHVNKTLLLIT